MSRRIQGGTLGGVSSWYKTQRDDVEDSALQPGARTRPFSLLIRLRSPVRTIYLQLAALLINTAGMSCRFFF